MVRVKGHLAEELCLDSSRQSRSLTILEDRAAVSAAPVGCRAHAGGLVPL